MGTTYRVKYWGSGNAAPVEVHREVESLLARFDRQMSTYRDDSELSRFNRAPEKEWFPVSPETAHVVAEAIKYHQFTNGALDVTVAPLLRLWRFGPGADGNDRAFAPQTEEQIERAKVLVGAERLRARREPPALWKDASGVEVDLSALAPGYAVDLVIELIESLGFANAMVEIGGEVRGVGARPGGKPWRIGVERAGSASKGLAEIVPLDNLALTTAGDYRNFRESGGVRVTHIIDPRSGRPLQYQGISVTVLANTALEADALDTALMVMGADRGYQWCVEHDIAALFQEGEEGRTIRRTPRFKQLIDSKRSIDSKRQ
jgi:thiamine biosynthesis lipoprotein